MPRVLVLLNPVASRAMAERRLATFLQPLHDSGWSLNIRPTMEPGQARALAQEAIGDGCDIVVVAGGDGTVNEAVQALAGTDTVLAVLPVGLANIWANEIGVGRPEAALRSLLDSQVKQVDLGLLRWPDGSQRYFLLMAGVGLDAETVRRTGARLKRTLRQAAYLWNGFLTALDRPGHVMDVDLGTGLEHYQMTLLLVANTPHYAGFVVAAPQARVDDGLLDTCSFRGRGFWRITSLTLKTLLGRHTGDPYVACRRVARVSIVTAGLPIQVDGEFAGNTPVEIHVAPAALRALVPRSCQSPLFSTVTGKA